LKIKRTLALLAMGGLVVMGPCAPAQAGTLLSGYGGPGDGSQAILGSTLLNSPGGQAGKGVGSSGGQAGVGGSEPRRAQSGSGGRRGAAKGRRGGSGAAAPAGSERAARRGGQGGGQPRSSASPARAAASVNTPALGITSSELALLIGVTVGLGAMWAGTRRMARHGGG